MTKKKTEREKPLPPTPSPRIGWEDNETWDHYLSLPPMTEASTTSPQLTPEVIGTLTESIRSVRNHPGIDTTFLQALDALTDEIDGRLHNQTVDKPSQRRTRVGAAHARTHMNAMGKDASNIEEVRKLRPALMQRVALFNLLDGGEVSRIEHAAFMALADSMTSLREELQTGMTPTG